MVRSSTPSTSGRLVVWSVQVTAVYVGYVAVMTLLPQYVLDIEPWSSWTVSGALGILVACMIVVLLVLALVRRTTEDRHSS